MACTSMSDEAWLSLLTSAMFMLASMFLLASMVLLSVCTSPSVEESKDLGHDDVPGSFDEPASVDAQNPRVFGEPVSFDAQNPPFYFFMHVNVEEAWENNVWLGIVSGMNGSPGIVRARDFWRDAFPLPTTPEEAEARAARQALRPPFRLVRIYDFDGVTLIDHAIEGRAISFRRMDEGMSAQ